MKTRIIGLYIVYFTHIFFSVVPVFNNKVNTVCVYSVLMDLFCTWENSACVLRKGTTVIQYVIDLCVYYN